MQLKSHWLSSRMTPSTRVTLPYIVTDKLLTQLPLISCDSWSRTVAKYFSIKLYRVELNRWSPRNAPHQAKTTQPQSAPQSYRIFTQPHKKSIGLLQPEMPIQKTTFWFSRSHQQSIFQANRSLHRKAPMKQKPRNRKLHRNQNHRTAFKIIACMQTNHRTLHACLSSLSKKNTWFFNREWAAETPVVKSKIRFDAFTTTVMKSSILVEKLILKICPSPGNTPQ